jgi:ABC-type uncharacterized transport system substrate-binding protein
MGDKCKVDLDASLELLRELIPQARMIGVLFNPNSPTAEHQMSEVQRAARTLGLEVHVVRASNRFLRASRATTSYSAENST